MTEAEWLNCARPREMLASLGGTWWQRFSRWLRSSAESTWRKKLAHFVAACCVRSTQGMTISDLDTELQTLVAFGKGEAGIASINFDTYGPRVPVEDWAAARAESAAKHWAIKLVRESAIANAIADNTEVLVDWNRIFSQWKKEREIQSHYLRDIFGNPFRPVAFDPAWRTATVISLAQAIYDERRFADLPILADALEDAGCTSADVLEHCRTPGEHVRGCWVVDLALGKE